MDRLTAVTGVKDWPPPAADPLLAPIAGGREAPCEARSHRPVGKRLLAFLLAFVWGGALAAAANPDAKSNQLSLSQLAGRGELVIETGVPSSRNLMRFDRADLRTSIERALGNSYDLASVRARAESQRQQIGVARGALLPKMDIQLKGGREISKPGSIVDPATNAPVAVSDHTRTDTIAFIRQSVVDVGAWREMDRQRLLAAASDSGVESSRDQVALDAASAHLDLLQYSLALDFARDYQLGLERLLAYVDGRSKAGGASPAEAERVNARAINARSSVIEATGALESAMISYSRLVGGVPKSVPAEDLLMPNVLPDVSAAIELAKRNNPSLIALRQNIDAIKAEADVARAKILPKLELELGNYRTRGAGGAPGMTNDTRLMLMLSMNVLNGGADAALTRSIYARLEEARYRLADAERKLEESILVTYNTLQAVLRRVDSVRQEYLANQKVEVAFGDQLVSGNRQLLDVLDAQQRLYQSRTEMLRLTVLESSLALQAGRLIGGLIEPETLGTKPELPPLGPQAASRPPASSAAKLDAAAPVKEGAAMAPQQAPKEAPVPASVPEPASAPAAQPASVQEPAREATPPQPSSSAPADADPIKTEPVATPTVRATPLDPLDFGLAQPGSGDADPAAVIAVAPAPDSTGAAAIPVTLSAEAEVQALADLLGLAPEAVPPVLLSRPDLATEISRAASFSVSADERTASMAALESMDELMTLGAKAQQVQLKAQVRSARPWRSAQAPQPAITYNVGRSGFRLARAH